MDRGVSLDWLAAGNAFLGMADPDVWDADCILEVIADHIRPALAA